MTGRWQPDGLKSPHAPITKTHARHFTKDEQGRYTITVGNNGSAPTDGSTVTVNDTLPPELHARSITGTGWTCTLTPLACTRNDPLATGSGYPPITLTVKASCQVPTTPPPSQEAATAVTRRAGRVRHGLPARVSRSSREPAAGPAPLP
ncbi:hypothetical protein ACIQZB_40355 [Streptomyces sp. NPDC097727]|uniref:hypothetical protein n=1 Tax=Streptomyces sp. NPDC097727 TaxID=3366092 RepID=UPI003816CD0C